MRLITVTGLAAMALAGAAQADPTTDSLAGAAAACIRAGAPQVAAQSQGLADAVSFLIDDLCAPDIRHLEAYDRNSRLLAVVHANAPKPVASADQASAPPMHGGAAKTLGQLLAVTINPDTGDLEVPEGLKSSLGAPLLLANWFSAGYSSSAAHARLRSIAAHAVLDAREKTPRR